MLDKDMGTTHPQAPEDRHLIENCQNGEPKAFEALYNRYSRDVYSMAMRMVGSPEVAEEVTQEAFISIYKNIQRFQFQSAFTTWVYRIVIRRAADYFRKNKKHIKNTVSIFERAPEESPLQIEDPDPGPLERAATREKNRKIEEAIYSLRHKQRVILILRYVNQLSYEEIAEILRCRVGTVKSRLNRAHKSLEQVLGQMDIEKM